MYKVFYYNLFPQIELILTNSFFLSEEKTRFKIFCENMRKAKKLQDVEKGTAVYGITKFSDMSGKCF